MKNRKEEGRIKRRILNANKTYQEVKTNEIAKQCASQDHPRYQNGKMDLVHATEPAVGMNVAIRSTKLHQVDALISDNLASQ